MSSNQMPDFVETLVRTGLETGEEDDRLLALKAANHTDRMDPSLHSGFGLEVTRTFMDQLGLEFEPGDAKINEQTRMFEMPGLAKVMKEVCYAVGSEIGIRSRFSELIGRSAGWQLKHCVMYVDDEHVTRMDDTYGALTFTRPFMVTHRFQDDRSRENLKKAVQAVRGIVGEGAAPDGSWLDAVGEIRTLDERDS